MDSSDVTIATSESFNIRWLFDPQVQMNSDECVERSLGMAENTDVTLATVDTLVECRA